MRVEVVRHVATGLLERAHRAARVAELDQGEGAQVVLFPTIAISPLSEAERETARELAVAFAKGQHEVLLCTSGNAAKHFCSLLPERASWIAAQPARVYSIGPATADVV